jgi:hypothetical protein
MGHYEDWTKTILFLLRKMWWNFNRKKRRWLADTNVPPWRQQPVNPILFAVYRAWIAKVTKQRPKVDVIPPSGDTDATQSAELAQSLVEDWHIRLRQAAKDKQMLSWVFSTGGSWRGVDWDPQGGRVAPRTALVDVPDPEAPTATPRRKSQLTRTANRTSWPTGRSISSACPRWSTRARSPTTSRTGSACA